MLTIRREEPDDAEAVATAAERVSALTAAPAVLGCSAGGVIAGGHGVEARSAVAVWAAVLVGVFMLLAWSYRAGVYFLVNGIQRAHHELRMRVSERSLDPRGFGDRQRPTGELLGRLGPGQHRHLSRMRALQVLGEQVDDRVALLAEPLGIEVVHGTRRLLTGRGPALGDVERRARLQERRNARD